MKKIEIKNKKAWMKIVESFIAILMIVSVLTVIVMKDLIQKPNDAEIVYEEEFSILQKIQINNTLRQKAINIDPIESTNPIFPFDFEALLEPTILSEFNCSLKICFPADDCILSNIAPNKEVYVKSILISSDVITYSPRKISIFCWKD